MFSISSPSFPSFSHEPNINPNPNSIPNPPAKRKRNLPGTPDPDAEVIALSPTSLMATNRFVCEVCNKGFQRDQNLQLHRRGHNLPWKLKQRSSNAAAVRKKVYICPERSCVHHEASRALGDLTGIKKHFSRKHGEKRWKCEKCSKKYAVQSDWKAHSKTCGTRQYKCDCGTLFSRKDSFITHRAFCDALTDESARTSVIPSIINNISFDNNSNNESNVLASTTRTHDLPLGFSRQDVGVTPQFISDMMTSSSDHNNILYANNSNNSTALPAYTSLSGSRQETLPPKPPAAPMSATALLQKAAQVGSTSSKFSTNGSFGLMRSSSKNQDRRSGNDDVGMADLERIMMQSLGEPKLNTGSAGPTRDFLGVGGESSRFMQDELARFASFGARAAMEFGQFANNH